MSFIIAALAIASGAVATYFYERRASLTARLCAGACIGLALLGFVGFVIASFIGLNVLSLTLATLLACAPLAALVKGNLRARLHADWVAFAENIKRALVRPNARTIAVAVFYAVLIVVLWQIFARACYVRDGEMYTGVENNLGDLPLHIGIIEGFARGENFPPQHPEFAGAKLTYPFIVDFVAAMFMRAGATLQGALFWQSFTLALALTGLLHFWAKRLTRSLLAACLVPALVFFNGGLGWVRAVRDALRSPLGLIGFLSKLPHDYGITPDRSFVWGNSLVALFVPQRGFLLGLPLAIIALTLLWRTVCDEKDEDAAPMNEPARKKGKKKRGKIEANLNSESSFGQANVEIAPSLFDDANVRRMIAAGLIVGLLPLVHAHTYMVMGGSGFLLALIFARTRREIIAWTLFLGIAFLVGMPQILWAMTGSAVQTRSFFGWHLGWDRGAQPILWFWLKNTGAFILLLIIALVALIRPPRDDETKLRARRNLQLALFYLPFAVWFIIPNLMTLAPWVWDNIKVLFNWYVVSTPLVAWLLARMFMAERYRAALRALMLALLFSLTMTGMLDVWRALSETTELRIYDRAEMEFAELIDARTAPRSIILSAPTYNSVVELAGRRELSGYAGHLWSHGIDYLPRQNDLLAIYAGASNADELLRRYNVEYVIISPVETATLAAEGQQVNPNFFERYEKVGQIGEYKLYKVARR
jgi:hypothetical protein